jgi:hypothetical protein
MAATRLLPTRRDRWLKDGSLAEAVMEIESDPMRRVAR